MDLALWSYAHGLYEALCEDGHNVDLVIGTQIGCADKWDFAIVDTDSQETVFFTGKVQKHLAWDMKTEEQKDD